LFLGAAHPIVDHFSNFCFGQGHGSCPSSKAGSCLSCVHVLFLIVMTVKENCAPPR
jgi:hypothetical protein